MHFTPLVLFLSIGVLAALGTAAIQQGIYGLRQPVQLAFLDLKSGNLTDIGPQFPTYFTAQELGDIDLRRHLFWTIIWDRTTQEVSALALHLENGTIAKKLPLPFTDPYIVGGGQDIDIVPATGHPIVVGRKEFPGPHFVMELDPETGALRHITEIDAPIDFLGSGAAYDMHTNQDWVMFVEEDFVIELFGVDIQTGEIQKVPETNGQVLTSMKYDPISKSLVGFGLHTYNDTVTLRTFNTFEPKSNRWTHRDLHDWLGEEAGLTALDVPNRVIYAIMQKTGADPIDDPWWLVGIDIETTTTKSAVKICGGDPFHQCVWSIEFYYEH